MQEEPMVQLAYKDRRVASPWLQVVISIAGHVVHAATAQLKRPHTGRAGDCTHFPFSQCIPNISLYAVFWL